MVPKHNSCEFKMFEQLIIKIVESDLGCSYILVTVVYLLVIASQRYFNTKNNALQCKNGDFCVSTKIALVTLPIKKVKLNYLRPINVPKSRRNLRQSRNNSKLYEMYWFIFSKLVLQLKREPKYLLATDHSFKHNTGLLKRISLATKAALVKYFNPSSVLKFKSKVSHPNSILLLNFPNVITVQFVTAWLKVGAFTRLDTAITSKLHRKKHLTALSSNKVIFAQMVDESNEHSCFKWMTFKKLSVRNLTIISTMKNYSLCNKQVSVFSHLRVLVIASYSTSCLGAVLEWCKHTIESLTELSAEYPDSLLISTHFSMCHQLTHLSLTGTSLYWDDTCLAALARHCPQLHSFNGPDLSKTTDLGWIQLSTGLSDLRKISISQAPAAPEHFYIQQQRNVSACVSGAAVVSFVNHCPQMADISAANCRKITDEVMREIATAGKSMTALDVSGTDITADGICAVLNGCDRLTKLNISQLRRIPFAVDKTYRKRLGLIWLSVSHCSNMNDKSVGIIANRYPNLTHCDLSACGGVTKTGLTRIASHMARLTHLDASIPNESISNDVIALIVHNNPNLYTLKVGGRMSGLKALVVTALWPRNDILTELDLSNCFRTADTGLIAVATCCPALTSLTLHNCFALTDNTLHVLVEKFLDLRSLVLTGCNKMTLKAIANLSVKLKKIKTLKH